MNNQIEFTTLKTETIMNNQTENSWDILDKVDNPFAGMLRSLYGIRFRCNRELNEEEKNHAFRCLNILAEGEEYDKGIRSWCHNQLGLILSGRSNFIRLTKSK
jgi:hypothetical protein